MANDFSAYIMPILSQSLLQLRQVCRVTRYINTSYSQEAANKTDTIKIPLMGASTVRDVAPSNVLGVPIDQTTTYVNLTLDKWKEVPFAFTDRDRYQFDNSMPSQSVTSAVNILAETINKDVLDTVYKGVYGVVGTAGTTPFASATHQDAVSIARVLDEQLAPPAERNVILNPAAIANAKMVPAFFQHYQNPTVSNVLATGDLGNVMNMNWHMQQYVPTHTAGTGASYQVNGNHAVGATTIALDTGTGTLVIGDIITFGNHTQTYTIVSGLSAPGNVTISPALRVATLDNVAVTKTANHSVNLAFQRDAIAFASRATPNSQVPGATMYTLVDDDPYNGTGLALQFEMQRQNAQDYMALRLMWGVKLIRPELAVRLLG